MKIKFFNFQFSSFTIFSCFPMKRKEFVSALNVDKIKLWNQVFLGSVLERNIFIRNKQQHITELVICHCNQNLHVYIYMCMMSWKLILFFKLNFVNSWVNNSQIFTRVKTRSVIRCICWYLFQDTHTER